jgi:hypothetical protein
MGRTKRGIARALFALALVGGGCGVPAAGGGGAGTTGSGGAATETGVGGGPGSHSDSCPFPIEHGTPCTISASADFCPITVCQGCIGGLFKLLPSPGLICLCRDGAWACPPDAGVRFATTNGISDCVVELPIACAEAKDVYTDGTCTEHAPCTP